MGVKRWLQATLRNLQRHERRSGEHSRSFMRLALLANHIAPFQMMFPWFSSSTLIQSGKATDSDVRCNINALSSSVPSSGGLTSKGSFPESRSIRYPTPGTLNPEVTLWLLDLSNLTDIKKHWIKEPILLEGQ